MHRRKVHHRRRPAPTAPQYRFRRILLRQQLRHLRHRHLRHARRGPATGSAPASWSRWRRPARAASPNPRPPPAKSPVRDLQTAPPQHRQPAPAARTSCRYGRSSVFKPLAGGTADRKFAPRPAGVRQPITASTPASTALRYARTSSFRQVRLPGRSSHWSTLLSSSTACASLPRTFDNLPRGGRPYSSAAFAPAAGPPAPAEKKTDTENAGNRRSPSPRVRELNHLGVGRCAVVGRAAQTTGAPRRTAIAETQRNQAFHRWPSRQQAIDNGTRGSDRPSRGRPPISLRQGQSDTSGTPPRPREAISGPRATRTVWRNLQIREPGRKPELCPPRGEALPRGASSVVQRRSGGSRPFSTSRMTTRFDHLGRPPAGAPGLAPEPPKVAPTRPSTAATPACQRPRPPAALPPARFSARISTLRSPEPRRCRQQAVPAPTPTPARRAVNPLKGSSGFFLI